MTYKALLHDGRMHYGKQILVDAAGCNENLRSIDHVSTFLAEMPGKIGMRAFGDPLVYRFGDGDEIGLSGVQLLYSSAVVLHTNDGTGDLYLDLFSCRDYDADAVLREIQQAFEPASMESRVLFRE